MRIGRDEAFALLKTWLDDSNLVCCQCLVRRFATSFRARVIGLSDLEVRLLSDDGTSEATIRLGLDLEFGFGDMRDCGDEAERFDNGLIAFLPGSPDDPDMIVFAQVKESNG